MARRRRRRTGTWLPALGTTGPEASIGDETAAVEFRLTVPPDGTSDIALFPLTFDQPVETDNNTVNTATPLNDFIGNEYVIQRIVGNLFINRAINLTEAGVDPSAGACYVVAALFVARAEDADVDVDAPIGSATLQRALANYSPLSSENIREPWIWRRSWLLGSAQFGAVDANTGFSVGLPSNNLFAYGGGVACGPFVDSRVKRRVRQDERLFFTCQARNFPLNKLAPDGVTPQLLAGLFDYRIFGSLRKAHNKSSL